MIKKNKKPVFIIDYLYDINLRFVVPFFVGEKKMIKVWLHYFSSLQGCVFPGSELVHLKMLGDHYLDNH